MKSIPNQSGHDYRWAPAPAVLRTICEKAREQLLRAIRDLALLLSAVSLDRALDRMPLESETSGGRKLSGNWQGLVMPELRISGKKANAA